MLTLLLNQPAPSGGSGLAPETTWSGNTENSATSSVSVTTPAGRLLVAIVQAGSFSDFSGTTFDGGAGLSWTLAASGSFAGGSQIVRIYTAYASSALTGHVISANNPTGVWGVCLTVVSFTGAKASQAGAGSATLNITGTAAASIDVAATAAGSIILAGVSTWNNGQTPAYGAGVSVHRAIARHGIGSRTALTTGAGTYTVTTSNALSDPCIAAVEVLADAGGGAQPQSGQAEGVSGAAAVGTGTGQLRGQATGVSGAPAVGSSTGQLRGQATGVSGAAAVGSSTGQLRGQASGVSSSPAVGAGLGQLRGQASGVSGAAAVGTGTGALTPAGLSGQATGVSGSPAVGTGTGLLRGQASGVSSSAAVGAGLGRLQGQAQSVSGAPAVGAGTGALAGQASGVGGAAATGTGTGHLVGQATGVSSSAAVGAGVVHLVGQATGVSGSPAVGTGTGAFALTVFVQAGEGACSSSSSSSRSSTGTEAAAARATSTDSPGPTSTGPDTHHPTRSELTVAHYYLKPGDTLPHVEAKLRDPNGRAPNLVDATVQMQGTKLGPDGEPVSPPVTLAKSATAQEPKASSGLVRWVPLPGDTAVHGGATFRLEWVVTFPGGGQATYPNGPGPGGEPAWDYLHVTARA